MMQEVQEVTPHWILAQTYQGISLKSSAEKIDGAASKYT